MKTDLRDARALAEACRSGTYRLAHRRSEQQRRVTAGLVVREALVRSRTSFISVVRALLSKEGLRAASGLGGALSGAGATMRMQTASGPGRGENADPRRARAARWNWRPLGIGAQGGPGEAS